MTCCFFSSLKMLAIRRRDHGPCRRVNVLSAYSLWPVLGVHRGPIWPSTCGGSSEVSRRPAEADAAAEFAVPDPAAETGQSGNQRTVRQSDRLALRFRVVELGDEHRRIVPDALQLLACGLALSDVVRRPASR